jgi:hypothetical protein
MIDDLMLSLTVWIARTTERPLGAPPGVVTRTATVRPSLSPLAPHRLAFYEAATGTIHLARDWDATDPIDQSVLLHALLHHAEAQAGTGDRHHHAREADAYRLQALWLAQQGIDFRQAFGVSPSLIARLDLCAGACAWARSLPMSGDGEGDGARTTG